MKTKEETTIKDFHAVTFFRKVKELISMQLAGKTFEEQKKILEQIQSGEIKLDIPKQ